MLFKHVSLVELLLFKKSKFIRSPRKLMKPNQQR